MRDADKKYEFNFVANLEMKYFWGEQGWGGGNQQPDCMN